MIKVHVLSGGNSPERDVSLRSSAAVVAALKAASFSAQEFDPVSASLQDIANCNVVFPVLHGAGGEDGTLQAQLEQAGVRYVGSDSKASALCFNKWQYHQVITKAGLPMSAGNTLNAYSEYADHPLAQNLHVLKPVSGGSSIDTFIVRDLNTVPHGDIEQAFKRNPGMLIERLIEGTELTVGVLGDTALPIIEIIPPENGEFDYTNKYNGSTQELIAPVSVSPAIQKAAQTLALEAHKLTGCRDFSRTDIMVDQTGALFLLETNTIPGMTDQSLFPKMAAAAGLPMPDLCKQLVGMALNR